jgi:hypothetical protein
VLQRHRPEFGREPQLETRIRLPAGERAAGLRQRWRPQREATGRRGVGLELPLDGKVSSGLLNV